MFVNVLLPPTWPMPAEGLTRWGAVPPPTSWPVWWCRALDWPGLLHSTAHRVTGVRTHGEWSLILLVEHRRAADLVRGLRGLAALPTLVETPAGVQDMPMPAAMAAWARGQRENHVLAEYAALKAEAVEYSGALVRHVPPEENEHAGWLPPMEGQPPTLGVVSMTPPPRRLLEQATAPHDPRWTYCPYCLGVCGAHDPHCTGSGTRWTTQSSWAITRQLAMRDPVMLTGPKPGGEP